MSDTKSEWQGGWTALLGCFVGMALGVHSLPLYGQAMFIKPIETDLGWSRVQISFATTIVVLTMAITAPIAGALADRINIRYLVSASAIGMSACFAWLSMAGNGLVSLYAPMAMMAILGAACSTLSYSRVVSAYFDRSRGAALGLAMTGTGFASILTPMLLGPYVAAHGWRAGYLALAWVMLIGAIMLALLVRLPGSTDAASRQSKSQDGVSFQAAVKDPLTWQLSLVFFLIPLAVGGLITHLLPMLTDAGLSPEQAAKQASGIGIAVIVARLTTGILIDRYFAPYVGAALMFVASLGLLALGVGGSNLAFIGALATGLAIGAEIDLVGFLVARYYGFRAFGRIYGLLYGCLMLGTAVSPILYATVRQSTGSYTTAILGACGMLMMSALLLLGLRRYKPESPNYVS